MNADILKQSSEKIIYFFRRRPSKNVCLHKSIRMWTTKLLWPKGSPKGPLGHPFPPPATLHANVPLDMCRHGAREDGGGLRGLRRDGLTTTWRCRHVPARGKPHGGAGGVVTVRRMGYNRAWWGYGGGAVRRERRSDDRGGGGEYPASVPLDGLCGST